MPDAVHDISSDRRFSREILPRVSRTFALNIRLLQGTLGESVRLAYLLCRAADALEDSWPGRPEDIRERFERFTRALQGDADAAAALASRAEFVADGRDDLGLVARLPKLLRLLAALPMAHRGPVVEGVTVLATGMCRYASRAAARPPGGSYLDTEPELDDYCWVVAGCVGVMLTQLFAVEHGAGDLVTARRRLDLAPIVGRALQLTNILLDWPQDVRRGRCYLPSSWLSEHGLTPADLVGADRPEARALAERLAARARESLARVPDYLDLFPKRQVRYRLFCLWPALWAGASLRAAMSDPEFPWGPRRPRISRGELLRTSLGSLLTIHRADTLRWLCGSIVPRREGAG